MTGKRYQDWQSTQFRVGRGSASYIDRLQGRHRGHAFPPRHTVPSDVRAIAPHGVRVFRTRWSWRLRPAPSRSPR